MTGGSGREGLALPDVISRIKYGVLGPPLRTLDGRHELGVVSIGSSVAPIDSLGDVIRMSWSRNPCRDCPSIPDAAPDSLQPRE